jgi:hypothetical protein
MHIIGTKTVALNADAGCINLETLFGGQTPSAVTVQANLEEGGVACKVYIRPSCVDITTTLEKADTGAVLSDMGTWNEDAMRKLLPGMKYLAWSRYMGAVKTAGTGGDLLHITAYN